MSIKLTDDGSSGQPACFSGYLWRRCSPRGAKVLLINEKYGTAVLGPYSPGQGWTHWQALPKFQEEVNVPGTKKPRKKYRPKTPIADPVGFVLEGLRPLRPAGQLPAEPEGGQPRRDASDLIRGSASLDDTQLAHGDEQRDGRPHFPRYRPRVRGRGRAWCGGAACSG